MKKLLLGTMLLTTISLSYAVEVNTLTLSGVIKKGMTIIGKVDYSTTNKYIPGCGELSIGGSYLPIGPISRDNKNKTEFFSSSKDKDGNYSLNIDYISEKYGRCGWKIGGVNLYIVEEKGVEENGVGHGLIYGYTLALSKDFDEQNVLDLTSSFKCQIKKRPGMNDGNTKCMMDDGLSNKMLSYINLYFNRNIQGDSEVNIDFL